VHLAVVDPEVGSAARRRAHRRQAHPRGTRQRPAALAIDRFGGAVSGRRGAIAAPPGAHLGNLPRA
jgi:hypothetical protein